jgi:hypothetical protein
LVSTIPLQENSSAPPYGEQPARQTNRDMIDRIVRTGKPHIYSLFMGTVLRALCAR